MSELLNQTIVLLERAQALADKCVQAWPRSAGYRGATNVQLAAPQGVVTFYATIPDGIGLTSEFDIKFLDNSDGIEAAAKTWYEERQAKINAHYNRLRELENSPLVQEYIRLKSHNPHGPYFPFVTCLC